MMQIRGHFQPKENDILFVLIWVELNKFLERNFDFVTIW